LKKNISKLSYGKKAREMKALEDALQKLPKHLGNFIRMQMKLHSRKKQGRRYSSEMKSIAISLYHMPVEKHTGCSQSYSFCQINLLFIDIYPSCHQALVYLKQR
jgi:hypothetical protein